MPTPRRSKPCSVDLFLQAYRKPPKQIILDLDATDDTIHGQQLGRFFHGYYGNYCYLPLYIFCGDHPLAAILRPSNIDASAGSLPQVQRIVAQIRQTMATACRSCCAAIAVFAREAT